MWRLLPLVCSNLERTDLGACRISDLCNLISPSHDSCQLLNDYSVANMLLRLAVLAFAATMVLAGRSFIVWSP